MRVQVALLLTLGTPHASPPLPVESGLVDLYHTLHEKLLKYPIISIAGGTRDTLVRSHLCQIPHRMGVAHSVVTTTMPGVQRPVDHRCLMWCSHLMGPVVAFLYRSLTLTTPEASTELLQAAERLLGPAARDEAYDHSPDATGRLGGLFARHGVVVLSMALAATVLTLLGQPTTELEGAAPRNAGRSSQDGAHGTLVGVWWRTLWLGGLVMGAVTWASSVAASSTWPWGRGGVPYQALTGEAPTLVGVAGSYVMACSLCVCSLASWGSAGVQVWQRCVWLVHGGSLGLGLATLPWASLLGQLPPRLCHLALLRSTPQTTMHIKLPWGVALVAGLAQGFHLPCSWLDASWWAGGVAAALAIGRASRA